MTEIADPIDQVEAHTPMLFGRFRTWLAMVAFVTILAGVLFGYDQGLIAGALGGMTASFDLSTAMQEGVTSLVTLGALLWIIAKVPGMKGKSLEEIQDAWAEHDEGRSAPKDQTLQVDLT